LQQRLRLPFSVATAPSVTVFRRDPLIQLPLLVYFYCSNRTRHGSQSRSSSSIKQAIRIVVFIAFSAMTAKQRRVAVSKHEHQKICQYAKANPLEKQLAIATWAICELGRKIN
jgi:hypothetical protein